jgi:hypothetical protein
MVKNESHRLTILESQTGTVLVQSGTFLERTARRFKISGEPKASQMDVF